MVYWKGSCPLLVGGLLLLNEVLLLQRQEEEWSQKEGAQSMSLNRGRGALWCVPKRGAAHCCLGCREGGGGDGGRAVLQTTILLLQRSVSGLQRKQKGYGAKTGD